MILEASVNTPSIFSLKITPGVPLPHQPLPQDYLDPGGSATSVSETTGERREPILHSIKHIHVHTNSIATYKQSKVVATFRLYCLIKHDALVEELVADTQALTLLSTCQVLTQLISTNIF